MTGFARSSGESGGVNWQWTIKSVNGKGLDVRFRLPFGTESLEPRLRKLTASQLSRGNLQVNLSLDGAGASGQQIDMDLMHAMARAAGFKDFNQAGKRTKARFLSSPNAVVSAKPMSLDDDSAAPLLNDIVEGYSIALDKLIAQRETEGAEMAALLSGHIEALEGFICKAEDMVKDRPEILHKQFKVKLTQLLSDDLPEDRLAQEAAILAVKADVSEELDRLNAHMKLARSHLSEDKPVGRRLDFLSQEINREINTFCSKVADASLTRIGLDMKTVNEQFREQSANIE